MESVLWPRPAAWPALAALIFAFGCAPKSAPRLEEKPLGGVPAEARRLVLEAIEPARDADLDGLDAARERTLGTRDSEADTDKDGLSDYAELVRHATDPSKADTDGDGAPDSTPSERRERAETLTVRFLVSDRLPVDDFSTFFQETRVVGFQKGWVEMSATIYLSARPYLHPTSTAARRIREPEIEPLLEMDATDLRLEHKEALRELVADSKSDLERAALVLGHLERFRPAVPALADYEAFLDVRVGERRIHWERRAPPKPLLEAFGADGLVERLVYCGAMFDGEWTGASGSWANLSAASLRAVGMPGRFVVSVPLATTTGLLRLKQSGAPGRVVSAAESTLGREAFFWFEARLASDYVPVAQGRIAEGWTDAPYLALFDFERFDQVDFPALWTRQPEQPLYKILSVEYSPGAVSPSAK